ncbi:MAG TPA: hypothetical protein VLM89_08795 [Phycisphaerae bacterium]|nr:hypothetical protein [Phycisphaerae bacterium]
MLVAESAADGLRFNNSLTVRFLWMPFAMTDPLRSCVGVLPLYRAEECTGDVPGSWRRPGTWFVPILSRAAVWVEFMVHPPMASAVKLGLDSLNLLTWTHWRNQLVGDPQDYMVLSDQPEVSPPNGMPETMTPWLIVGFDRPGSADHRERKRLELAHLRVRAFQSRPDTYSKRCARWSGKGVVDTAKGECGGASTPLLIKSDHSPMRPPADPYGITTWDPSTGCAADIYLVGCLDFRRITGEEPPPPMMVPGLARDVSSMGE